nr:hypothetical protein [uncultured Rhodoferax sp.]
MLETISVALDIGEKTPPAIDYFYMPPRPQWVPDLALKKAHQNRGFWLSVVGLHNLSAKVLSSIRIKLPFAPGYEPVLDSAGAAIEAKYDIQTHELQIPRLDPGEKLYVAIFLSSPEADRFQEPRVIVGDRLLSRGMRTVGFFKSRPKEALLLVVPLLLALAALGVVGYITYQVSPFNPKVKAVEAAMAGYSGCIPSAYEKTEVNETLLAKHKLSEQSLLQLNHVVTRKDLFDKDLVVICEDR